MALKDTIIFQVGLGGYAPPFKSNSDAFYGALKQAGFEIAVYKATDPEDPVTDWTEQDGANSPATTTTLVGYAAVQDGDIIHIVAWTSTVYEYYTFDMSTDLWSIDEAIITPANAPTQPWASIAVRSGVPVVVYAGDTDQVMGGKKERVDVAHRDGGSWTTGIALDAAGDNHYGNPSVVKGPLTDDMHILWQQTANTADPPTAWERFEARTLDSLNSLSTLVTDTRDTSGVLLGMNNAVSYDDAGTQRMLWSGADGTPARIFVPATEDGSDDITIGTTISDSGAPSPDANVEVGVITTAELGGEIHVLFGHDLTQDLFYITSTDDGATWSTAIEELNLVDIKFVSANIYVRDINTVLAYFYSDGATQKYNEKVLIAGQNHQIMM